MSEEDIASIVKQLGAFQHIERERGAKRLAALAEAGACLMSYLSNG
jgi:hypothetical protein